MKRNTVNTAMEHRNTRSRAFSWDEIRYFLTVCDTGSFRAAAEALGTSVNRVRRKVETLEDELSTVLLIRSSAGVKMTPDARSVYSVGVEIQEKIGYLDNFAIRKASAAEGLVRLTVTEGLGTFWITPHLVAFGKRYPRIRIDLRCEMRVPDLSKLESDVAVQLEEPNDDSLVRKKIATLHFMAFASHQYIAAYGVPQRYEELANHRVVHMVADQVPHHILNERTAFDPQLKFASIITNTSSSQAMAIADGAGIGILPTYAGALSKNLVPLVTPFRLARSVWLVYNPSAIELQRVRSVVDWITEIFNPMDNPWFRDSFIAPDDFVSKLNGLTMFQRSIGWHPEFPEILDAK